MSKHCVIVDARLATQKLHKLLIKDHFDQAEILELLEEIEGIIDTGDDYANDLVEDKETAEAEKEQAEAEAYEWEKKYDDLKEEYEEFMEEHKDEKVPWNLQPDPFKVWHEEFTA